MMAYISKEALERLRKTYTPGTRIELVKMDDFQAPPIGTHGTVRGVDDIGSIMVAWDNGSGLSVAYGEDIVKKLDCVKTICYGEEKVWDSREEAEEYFLEAMAGTEGAEHERYSNIYIKLKCGMEVCSDD